MKCLKQLFHSTICNTLRSAEQAWSQLKQEFQKIVLEFSHLRILSLSTDIFFSFSVHNVVFIGNCPALSHRYMIPSLYYEQQYDSSKKEEEEKEISNVHSRGICVFPPPFYQGSPSLSHSPLPVLPIFELHGQIRHNGAVQLGSWIKKNQLLTTTSFSDIFVNI